MSKPNKKDVGKGIRALLANIDKAEKSQKKGHPGIGKSKRPDRSIDLSYIKPNPFQPREKFDDTSLAELKESISTHGIIQPIAVRKLNDKNYQIISGERRWRAAKELKLKEVPVHILEADNQAMLEIALLENIQRRDLNPIEIAVSFQKLISECKLTHEELASRIGKKRSSITNYLRLLKLSPSVQDALKSDQISLGHAKILAGLEHIENQTLVLGKILTNDLSVRATEEFIKDLLKDQKKKSKKSKPANPAIKKIEDQLSEKFGIPVKINRNKKGTGFIKIPFSTDNEFNDIVDSLFE